MNGKGRAVRRSNAWQRRIGSRVLPRALEEAGYELQGAAHSYPLLASDVSATGRRGKRRYAIYLLTSGPQPQRSSGTHRRVRFFRGAELWAGFPEDHRPVVLAYSPRQQIFVGWPAAALEHALADELKPVDPARIRQARSSRWLQFISGGHRLVAFRPERMRVALRLLTEPAQAARRSKLPDGVTGSAYPRPPRRRRAQRVGSPLIRRAMVAGVPRDAYAPRARRRPRRPRPKVETGFSPLDNPAAALRRDTSLAPGGEYVFWFGVGIGSGASIEEAGVSLPEQLPDAARLTVRLVSLDEAMPVEGPDRGEIEITAEGAVVRVEAASVTDDPALRAQRLFFRVLAPGSAGTYRMRCSVYYGSTLVQSRLIKARVGPGQGRALSSRLDYRMSDRLALDELSRLPAHDLSLVVNGDGHSHELHFFHGGRESFASTASLEADQLVESIDLARQALCQVAWGATREWDGKVGSYRYRSSRQARANFAEDLATLARAGAGLYTEIAADLAGGIEGRERLEEISRRPGRVQIAAVSASLYVPAGLFYDHPISDAPAAGAGTSVCEEFLAAMKATDPLESSICMVDGCPNRECEDVVCPSGFWGFRHELGWPPSMEGALPPPPSTGESAKFLIGVSTDAKLRRRARHVDKVAKLAAAENVEVTESLEGFERALKARALHLVYMYCHGGMRRQVPYVELGAPGSAGLTRNFLRTHRPWSPPPPRSVVFINGCHTTKVGPKQILSLASGFVREANAAGVIGTELTVFEPLACAFAEAMLPGLLNGERSVGGAVRHARLELLREPNPLGLVYVPFLAADTRLVAQP